MSQWDLSCPDWEKRIKRGDSLIPQLPIDQVAGERAVRVFDKLRLADVPGTPTMAEACGDWFREIVRVMFGSLDPVTRARAIRELFLLVPKKNSKTTYGALLMLTALLLNYRPQASMIMTAPVQDVAQLAYDAAAGAIELDPTLKKILQVKDHLKTIIHRQTKAELSIMSFDPAALTGQKTVACLIDELHVVAKMRKAPSAIRQLRGGMMPFPEAFLAFITTQSEEAPAGVFLSELRKARAIRDGEQKGAMLPVIYELPESIQKDDDQWRDPENWRMVTPNLGRSIQLDRLIEDQATAELTGEAELKAWASQHLNIEIGLALRSDSWPGASYWEPNGSPGMTFEEVLERSEVITIGIDGGGLDDLLGLAIIGRCRETGTWLHWGRAWAHPSVLERRKSEAQRFQDFADQGDLVLVEQIGQDVDELASICGQVFESGLMDQIGVDPVGLGSILDALADEQIPEEKVVGISQGWRMSGAIKTVERKLAEGTFEHCASPLMAWCVGNAKVVPVGNAINITKAASGSAKIDPLMALFDAAELMGRNPAAATDITDFLRSPVTAA